MRELQKNTQIANRYGLNISLCDAYNPDTVCQTIEFANISSVNIEGGTTFARGGAGREKSIGFYDNIVGEFVLSTQILTNDLLCLMAGGGDSWDGESPIVFKNRFLEKPRIYVLKAETVWQDKEGNVYSEFLTIHRTRPRVAFGRNYSGETDVASVDIVFDIMEDNAGRVISRRGDESGLDVIVVEENLIAPFGYVDENGVWFLNADASITAETLQF